MRAHGQHPQQVFRTKLGDGKGARGPVQGGYGDHAARFRQRGQHDQEVLRIVDVLDDL